MNHQLKRYLVNLAASAALVAILTAGLLLTSCSTTVAPDGTRTYTPDQQAIATVAGIAVWEYARKHHLPVESIPDAVVLPPPPAVVLPNSPAVVLPDSPAAVLPEK